MGTANGPTVERFTLWSGALVVVAGVLMLLDRGGASVMVDQNYVFLFWGTIARVATALALCVGFVVLAFGRRGGEHVTGESRGGPWLLSLFGAVLILDTIVLIATRHSIPAAAVLLVVVQIVAAAAGLWAARLMYRTAIADKSKRVLAAITAIIFAVFSILELIPSTGTHAAANMIYVLFPLSLIALGASVLVDGRHARVRSQIEVIRSRW